jgi:chaperone LolA
MSGSRLSLCCALFALMLTALARSAGCLTAEELALKLENNYRSFESLSMDFVKVVRSEIFETESSTEGRMLFKNPDKFKIETKDEAIISDGNFIWTYSAENKQVIKNSTDRSQDFFKPYQYLSDFRSGYVPQLEEEEEKIDHVECFRLLLSAKAKDAFIRKMTVWVEKKSLLAKRLEYEDSNDNHVTLTFQHIKTNRKIKDSEFTYHIPSGVEEVDLTQ